MWDEPRNPSLVLDEVITFRSTYGGAQGWYNITPDLTAMGKMIGGGFPVGAIAGRKEVMDVMNPLAKKVLFPHSGTFSANPVTMTAGLVSMIDFDEEAVDQVNALATRAMQGINEAIAETGIKACVTGGDSMFRVHLKEHPPHNYREAYTTPEENARLVVLLDHLFDEGFLMINTCAAVMATSLRNTDIDALVAALKSGFVKIR
ncbi:MAG: aminotransferase class III-fold pyridoxal phosphate-dependent enzyme [bacterium]|nr:aminotransferase class III-fold pyridoxal phosphate-dependent enzyme [bacterium]